MISWLQAYRCKALMPLHVDRLQLGLFQYRNVPCTLKRVTCFLSAEKAVHKFWLNAAVTSYEQPCNINGSMYWAFFCILPHINRGQHFYLQWMCYELTFVFMFDRVCLSLLGTYFWGMRLNISPLFAVYLITVYWPPFLAVCTVVRASCQSKQSVKGSSENRNVCAAVLLCPTRVI